MNYHPQLCCFQRTYTGHQTHVYSGKNNKAILPQLGTILYRRDKNKSDIIQLVVVHVQSKTRGVNKGIVDLVSLLPIVEIEDDQIYCQPKDLPFILRLTNRGEWFSKDLLKLYDLSWDKPISSPTTHSNLTVAASSELAKDILSNPIPKRNSSSKPIPALIPNLTVISRSWETKGDSSPERDRSKTLSSSGTIPHFFFPAQ
jgi:hypothetical protein